MTPLIFAFLLASADTDGPKPAAQTPAPAGQAASQNAAQPSKNDPDKVVCRTEDKVGTNVRIRVCKTRAQWAEGEAQVQRFFRDSDALSGHSLVQGSGNTPP